MPIDRGTIDQQLRDIGEGERWWEQREFRDLPYVLHADERLKGLAEGKLVLRRTPRMGPRRTWLFIATDLRLICLRRHGVARQQVEIPAGHILRVRQRNRLRSYQIALETAARTYWLRISKDDAFRFAGAIVPLLPPTRAQTLGPELEPLSWIPGLTTVAALPGVAAIVSRVSMLSPPDNGDRDRSIARLEGTVDRLQADVDRLQQQVAFLENLLEKKVESSYLPRVSVTDSD